MIVWVMMMFCLNFLYTAFLFKTPLLQYTHSNYCENDYCVSNMLPVVSGVPQGSVLGSLLFWYTSTGLQALCPIATSLVACMQMTMLCTRPYLTPRLHILTGKYSVTLFLDCQQLNSPEVPLHDFYQNTPTNSPCIQFIQWFQSKSK